MDLTAANIRFDALRNAIYHSARRRFLDRVNRLYSFVIVAAGTGAVGDLGAQLHIDAKFLAAAAAFAGALQLVYDSGSRSRTHEFLQKRFHELVSDVAEMKDSTQDELKRLDAVLHRIYADEPPQLRALDAVAYNAACDTLGFNTGKRVVITFWQSLFRQVYPFNGSHFNLIEERNSVKGGFCKTRAWFEGWLAG